MSDVHSMVESSFRKLIKDKRFRSISVKEICEQAYVSRKTFYLNFNSKEDIITYVLRRDIVQPIADVFTMFKDDNAWQLALPVIERIYRAVYEDGEFYRNLVVPTRGKDEMFVRVATDVFYDLCYDLLAGFEFQGGKSEYDFVSYHFASGEAMMLEKWIYDGFDPAPEELARIHSSMILPYWSQLSSK